MTLLLSQYILPEDLFPWLTLASGSGVVVGLGVLGAGCGGAARHHDHAHHHDHGPVMRTITATTHHHPPDKVTTKGLIAMGAAAG